MAKKKVRFSDAERERLLELHGIGPTVIQRFEEMGISTFEALAEEDAASLCRAIADKLASPCWGNNPRVLAVIDSAIMMAREATE